jgi:hypothetical protein
MHDVIPFFTLITLGEYSYFLAVTVISLSVLDGTLSEMP